MVSPTPSNKYVVVGESRVHKTLADLVEFHQKVRTVFFSSLSIGLEFVADALVSFSED